MEKDQIVILEDRGLISVEGLDSKDFLQNIMSNDINLVGENSSIFSGIFTPQGKYLYEFFVVKSTNGYMLECDNELVSELVKYLSRYIFRSKVQILDLSSNYVIGIINENKFKEIQDEVKSNNSTIIFRNSYCFIDSRLPILGARVISELDKLYLTIKKLNLKIIDKTDYFNFAHKNGVPIKGTKNLQNALFGLESNFEELNGVNFKKGCFVGQENTARMKLRKKVVKRLLPISSKKKLTRLSEITFNNKIIGKILITDPFPFALIKTIDPDLNSLKDKQLRVNEEDIKITVPNWINL